MLLTQLHETISKRAKTTEDLQKLLDAADCEGLEAFTHDNARITSVIVSLRNLITPGELPFSVINTNELPAVDLSVALPTLRTLKGLSNLEVRALLVNSVNERQANSFDRPKPLSLKLETLEGMPRVTKRFDLSHAPLIKTLAGARLAEGVAVSLNHLTNLETLAGLDGVKTLKLDNSGGVKSKLMLKHVPSSLQELDLTYFIFHSGMALFAGVPQRVDVKLDNGLRYMKNGSIEVVPANVAKRLLAIREKDQGTKGILEAQQLLIDSDLDDLADF